VILIRGKLIHVGWHSRLCAIFEKSVVVHGSGNEGWKSIEGSALNLMRFRDPRVVEVRVFESFHYVR
jgi:hypothetical protein